MAHQRIVVAGGGAAGLLAALQLARAGNAVTVLDRDLLEAAPDVESAAASAFRPAAPQIVQAHLVMARCRELIRQRLPDVYADLLAAGVVESPLTAQMPAALPDRTPQPGDERLTLLLTRRSTVDWVLRRTAQAEPGITLGGGVRVTGLAAEPGRPPHVTGVHTDHGNFAADLVIDATGRRSPIDRWLGQLGAARTATWQAECGVAYFTRHYRLRPGMRPPDDAMLRTIAGLDEFTAGRWPADNGSVMLAVAPLAADRRFRTLGQPEMFTEVLRAIPGYSDWLDVLEPVSGVYPMAGLRNTLRRLVRDQAPVVTGLHAIGDTVCTTNPTLGRGLSLAITGAADLIDTLERHESDPVAQAISLDALVAAHIAPFYEDQAVIDAQRLAGLRHAIFGEAAPAPDPSPAVSGRVSNAQLRAAAPFDPVLFRAYWKLLGMLCHPAEIYHDPEVVARTDEILRRDGTRPQSAQFQLTR